MLFRSHQARSGGTRYIFASPGLASYRRHPLSSNVRPRRNMPLLLVAPSNLLPARRSACFGAAAKTAVASEALTSVGVRGTRLRTSTAHDLAQSVVTAPHVAVASGRLIVVLFGSRAVRNPRPRRCALEALAAIEGEAQGATPRESLIYPGQAGWRRECDEMKIEA